MTYGPNVNAAAILLASAGNVPVERTAMLMQALLASPVSTGFVARAHQRFAERLEQAGFDAAMAAALTAEGVLCGDETPVNVVGKTLMITVRRCRARGTWFACARQRSGWSGTGRCPQPCSTSSFCGSGTGSAMV